MPRRRILLFTELPVFAEGVRATLAPREDLELLATINQPQNLIQDTRRLCPDLLLIDWGPSLDWPIVAAACAAVDEQKVILFVRNAAAELVYQAREAGVAAVLDLHTPIAQVIQDVDRVLAGEVVFSQSMDESLRVSRTVRLTPREGELVALLAQGLKNKEIATSLNISEGTVKVYLSKLFQKVGAKDRFELALFGLKNLTSAEMGFFEELPPRKPATPLRMARPHCLRSIVVRPSVVVAAPAFYRVAAAR